MKSTNILFVITTVVLTAVSVSPSVIHPAQLAYASEDEDDSSDQSQSDQSHSQHSTFKCLGSALVGSVIGGSSGPLGSLGSGMLAGATCALDNN
jgi:hypothetical protein